MSAGKMRNNKAIVLSKDELKKALARASAFLNDKFAVKDIELRLVLPDDNATYNAYAEQWHSNDGEIAPRFNWEEKLAASKLTASFCLAVFKEGTLYGLCENKPQRVYRDRALIIESIEGHPDKKENPLKGRIVAAFMQANLDIAKDANLQSVGVCHPYPATWGLYKRLGVVPHDATNEFWVMKVSQDASLNWSGFSL